MERLRTKQVPLTPVFRYPVIYIAALFAGGGSFEENYTRGALRSFTTINPEMRVATIMQNKQPSFYRRSMDIFGIKDDEIPALVLTEIPHNFNNPVFKGRGIIFFPGIGSKFNDDRKFKEWNAERVLGSIDRLAVKIMEGGVDQAESQLAPHRSFRFF